MRTAHTNSAGLKPITKGKRHAEDLSCKNSTGKDQSEANIGSIYNSVVAAEGQLVLKKNSSVLIVPPGLFLDAASEPGTETIPWLRDGIAALTDPDQLGIRIELPEAGQIRARNLIRRSRHVATGIYPSWKMGRLMQWESRVESKVFRLLDICPAITRYAEQPFTIHYFRDGKWHIHIPDVAVETCFGQRWILEVKSTKDRKLQEALEREKFLTPLLRLMGCNYAVVLQEAIEAGTSVANANLLLKHGRGCPTASSHQQFMEFLGSGMSLSRAALLGKTINGEHAIRTASQLVLRGLLSPDWRNSNTSEISFCTKTNDNFKESLQWLLHALGAINRL